MDFNINIIISGNTLNYILWHSNLAWRVINRLISMTLTLTLKTFARRRPDRSSPPPVRRCSSHGTLSSFPHGAQSCSGVEGNVYGSVCSHTCDTGYALHGSKSVMCLVTSTWSQSFPNCQRECSRESRLGPVVKGLGWSAEGRRFDSPRAPAHLFSSKFVIYGHLIVSRLCPAQLMKH